MAGPSHSRGRLVRRHARMALFALLAITIFSGTALAGSLSFYCEAMHAAGFERCCARTEASATQPEVSRAPCCQGRRASALPSTLVASKAKPIAASQPMLLPVPPFAARASALAFPAWTRCPPTGPPRPADPSRLMVFRN